MAGTNQPNSDTSSEQASHVPPAHPVGIKAGYQPALDGIRAIAVTLVALFHLDVAGGPDIVRGGWLGVDVFFVLSGYLITSLLLDERRRNGHIKLGHFYVRRFLRLAPLSVALVVFCLSAALFDGERRFDINLPVKGALSVLFYYSNWWSIRFPAGLGSLGHAWSLSIEEQFYFVWPWLVVVLLWAGRKRASRNALLVVTVVLVAAMGLGRYWYWSVNTQPDTPGMVTFNAWMNLYRNSLLRPDGLLYGCLLAVVLHGVRSTMRLQRIAAACGIVGAIIATLIIMAAHPVTWTPWVAFIPVWGLSLFNASILAVVAWLVLAPRSWFARVLSLKPVVWIGRRAYGIYLFHFIIIYAIRRHMHWYSWRLAITTIILTLVVSGVSFRWFESPFLTLKERFSSRTPSPVNAGSTTQ